MKQKTHRGAAKRFKKTKSGKIKRSSAYKRHILTKKGPKRKRHLRGTKVLSPAETPKVKRMLPYA
ncbi:MAG TPA: 50S ribosomal protein L35 [Acidobacteriota bacterium]|jgi:large subunit ribosomal protein L35|nr:50S ribosomal protein L35 [Acidobacteriota bacterium]